LQKSKQSRFMCPGTIVIVIIMKINIPYFQYNRGINSDTLHATLASLLSFHP